MTIHEKIPITRLSKEEVNELPLKRFSGKTTVVKTLKDINDINKHLLKHQVLGMDTEWKPVFKKGRKPKLALLQIATEDHAYLFQLHQIGGIPKEITKIFQSKNIVKVGLELGDEIEMLRKINPFTPHNFVDLGRVARKYNFGFSGSKNMVAHFLDFRISKSQQLSNWENKDLTNPQIQYASTDAWICLKLYKKFVELGLIETPNIDQ